MTVDRKNRGVKKVRKRARREREPKKREAEEREGTSRAEQWPKITGRNQRRRGRWGELADLHKTLGYPRPLFSPRFARKENHGRGRRWARKEGPTVRLSNASNAPSENCRNAWRERPVRRGEKACAFLFNALRSPKSLLFLRHLRESA